MHRLIRASGTATLLAVTLLSLLVVPSYASGTPGCRPAITTSTQPARRADGAIVGLDVTTVASATDTSDDRLVSATIARVVNAAVQVDGQPVTVPTTLSLPSPKTWTFRVQRLNPDQPFQVEYAVRDQCGEIARFAGAGIADGRSASPGTGAPVGTGTPTPNITPTPGGTAIPTATSTPSASPVATTVTPTPTATFDPVRGVVPGSPRLTATFNSIGVEVPFAGDADHNASATLEFRRQGDAIWRAGLPLWPTYHPSGAAFYGSALLLDPGTPYEVRVTVSDPVGVGGAAMQTASITTRAETIPDPSALTPGYFVQSTGDDSNDGRSVASAWRTVDKAIQDAPSGATVQVGPGHYPTERGKIGATAGARTTPLTLVAQFPAVDGERHPTDTTRRSVIEPVGLSAPTGASDGPNPGVWRQVTLTGPRTGASFTVWTWAGSPVGDASQLGYAATRADAPIRVAHWKKDANDLALPAGWAEKLHTNLTYSYGFYASGRDVYLRLPGDLDPNTLYLTMSNGTQTALSIGGPDVRVSGFEIRQFTNGVDVLWDARNAVIDRNLLTGNQAGVSFRGEGSTYGSDHVVQENLIQGSSLWSLDPQAATIPWMFIKSTLRNADGTDYATTKLGAASETAGITGRGGAKRVVVRRNTIDGLFDGVGSGYNEGFDRYSAQDMDVYDNLIRHLADDALEPEFSAINFRAWNNQIEETLTVLSTGPVNFGPVYLFLNTAVQTGSDGVGHDGQGRAPGGVMFKYSGTSDTPARVFGVHNTFWTDRAVVSGGGQYASSGSATERFWLRNNLIRATHYAFDAPGSAGSWDEDGNYFVTTSTVRGLKYRGAVYGANVQVYRGASGQGAHTNVASGFTADLPSPTLVGGDLRLPAGSPLRGAGVPVPNISDGAGSALQAPAPDIGDLSR